MVLYNPIIVLFKTPVCGTGVLFLYLLSLMSGKKQNNVAHTALWGIIGEIFHFCLIPDTFPSPKTLAIFVIVFKPQTKTSFHAKY
jgi:hypothetical protein